MSDMPKCVEKLGNNWLVAVVVSNENLANDLGRILGQLAIAGGYKDERD